MNTNPTLILQSLRAGQDVLCPCCNNGHMKSTYGDSPQTAKSFSCDSCGEKIILNVKSNYKSS